MRTLDRVEVDSWMHRVDIEGMGIVLTGDEDEDKNEADNRLLEFRHSAYRAAGIWVMNQAGLDREREMVASDSMQTNLTKRIGERYESKRIKSSPGEEGFMVALARDKKISLRPAFLGGEKSHVTREVSYIRDLRFGAPDSDPDVSLQHWSMNATRNIWLPPLSNNNSSRGFGEDVARFGRTIAGIALSAGYELPRTVEDFQSAKLEV